MQLEQNGTAISDRIYYTSNAGWSIGGSNFHRSYHEYGEHVTIIAPFKSQSTTQTIHVKSAMQDSRSSFGIRYVNYSFFIQR